MYTEQIAQRELAKQKISPAQIKQQQDEANANQTIQSYMSNPMGMVNLPTSPQVASNLSQVGALTGQNIFDIGRMSTQYQNLIQNRLAGKDEESRYLQQQRNRNMSDVGRAYSGRKMAGGAAIASQNQARQSADAEINRQMQQKELTNMDLLARERNRNQAATSQAVAGGQQFQLATQMPTQINNGNTVICTEMHRQGIIDDETYQHDSAFGKKMLDKYPEVIHGYHFWAVPIVNLMKKSKLFTNVVSFFAKPWALGMNKESSFVFKIVTASYLTIGFIPCFLIGHFRMKNKVVLNG